MVKLHLFLKVVKLHIKLKAFEHRAPRKQICFQNTSATLELGSKGHFVFFSKSGHVAYQIKVEEV